MGTRPIGSSLFSWLRKRRRAIARRATLRSPTPCPAPLPVLATEAPTLMTAVQSPFSLPHFCLYHLL
ncbi:Serine/Threonine-Protein Kinase Nek9 [Manis pentadactyla]|nr:Serine/Threonine-Protein Kinase Nek9 [Manis pentadactyla]